MGIQEKFDHMMDLVTGSSDPELLKSVMAVQRDLISIQEENRNLRNEVHDLKNERIVESELIFRDGVYLKGKRVFCSVCWDNNKRLVRVRKNPVYNDDGKDILFYCDVCKDYRYSDINDDEISNSKHN